MKKYKLIIVSFVVAILFPLMAFLQGDLMDIEQKIKEQWNEDGDITPPDHLTREERAEWDIEAIKIHAEELRSIY